MHPTNGCVCVKTCTVYTHVHNYGRVYVMDGFLNITSMYTVSYKIFATITKTITFKYFQYGVAHATFVR